MLDIEDEFQWNGATPNFPLLVSIQALSYEQGLLADLLWLLPETKLNSIDFL